MIKINIESFYRNLDPIMLVNNANKTLQCIELFQLLKVESTDELANMTRHTGQMGGSNAGFGIWVDVNESKH